MKKGFSLLMILGAAWLVVSCNNGMQSYTEMLEAEQEAMEKFMAEAAKRRQRPSEFDKK